MPGAPPPGRLALGSLTLDSRYDVSRIPQRHSITNLCRDWKRFPGSRPRPAQLRRVRMQRDSVALRIADNGSETVGADLVFVLHNHPAALLRRLNRLIQPALHTKINQRAMLRRPVILRLTKTTRHIGVWMRQEAKLESGAGLFGYRLAKHSRIKLDGPIEVRDGNVSPTECVSFAHLDGFRFVVLVSDSRSIRSRSVCRRLGAVLRQATDNARRIVSSVANAR